MVRSEDRLRQIAELEREMENLLEERVALDLALRSTSLRLNYPRRLYIRFTIRGLGQRLDRLKLNRNMAYNGYLQLLRDEARRS